MNITTVPYIHTVNEDVEVHHKLAVGDKYRHITSGDVREVKEIVVDEQGTPRYRTDERGIAGNSVRLVDASLDQTGGISKRLYERVEEQPILSVTTITVVQRGPKDSVYGSTDRSLQARVAEDLAERIIQQETWTVETATTIDGQPDRHLDPVTVDKRTW